MSITQLRHGRLPSARRIARSLGHAEGAIDSAILAQAELIGEIIKGGAAAGTAMSVSHPAFARAMSVLDALAVARGHGIECHDQLASVRDKYRMSSEDVGCTSDKVAGALIAAPIADAA